MFSSPPPEQSNEAETTKGDDASSFPHRTDPIDAVLQIDALLEKVLSFLRDDGNSVAGLALSSKKLHGRILCPDLAETESNPRKSLWDQLIRHRWKRTRRRPGSTSRAADNDNNNDNSNDNSNDNNENEGGERLPISSRQLYIEKRKKDSEALALLDRLANILQRKLRLSDDNGSDITYESDTEGRCNCSECRDVNFDCNRNCNRNCSESRNDDDDTDDDDTDDDDTDDDDTDDDSGCCGNCGKNEDKNEDKNKNEDGKENEDKNKNEDGNEDGGQYRRVLPSDDSSIGMNWDHQIARLLMKHGADYYDVLKATAQRELARVTAESPARDRLSGYLAARCFQNVHLGDCLWEMKRLLDEEESWRAERERSEDSNGSVSQLTAARFLEQHALLAGEVQKTPLERLKPHDAPSNPTNDRNETGNEKDSEGNLLSTLQFAHRAGKTLDRIADVCREQILREGLEGNDASRAAKLRVVNDVLVNRFGFSGNSRDYYNYRNVLLDEMLKTKTGMPLTLCVLYSSVCRRLGIPVQLIGLPGHVVLGFDTDGTDDGGGDDEIERRSYMDVFRGGRILSADDCRRIVAAYRIPWRDEYLAPVSTSMVLTRIFNNLRNCHQRASIVGPDRKMNCKLVAEFAIPIVTMEGIYHHPAREISRDTIRQVSITMRILLERDLLRAFHLLE